MQTGPINLRVIASDRIFVSFVHGFASRNGVKIVENPGQGVSQLILDFPLMWAFGQLENMDSSERSRTIVVTQRSHNAYLDTLGSYHVSAVLDRGSEDDRLLSSVFAASIGLRTYKWRSGLTYMELRITRLLLKGLDTSGIAESLRVSPKTVNAHISNILTKLGHESRTQYLAALVGQYQD
ncbi:MAG: helix-turn-helix transcriptional regulator [Trueperaceae bacterium]|nr:helix-turn-helix transcriptional regulator [Trueperaceae bacterium]